MVISAIIIILLELFQWVSDHATALVLLIFAWIFLKDFQMLKEKVVSIERILGSNKPDRAN